MTSEECHTMKSRRILMFEGRKLEINNSLETFDIVVRGSRTERGYCKGKTFKHQSKIFPSSVLR